MEAEDLTSVASRSYFGHTTYTSEAESGSSVDKRNQHEIGTPVIANKENRAIARAKLLIAFVLVLGVAALVAAVVLLVNGQEKEAFENQFAAYGSEVIHVAEQKADQLFKALDSFSLGISSAAAVKNETWPFVTVDDFSRKARKLIALSGVGETEMAFCPIVPVAQKGNWTIFVRNEAPKWYQTSIDSEGSNATVEEYLDQTVPFLHRFDLSNNFALTQVDRPGYSVPIWHSYPLAPGLIIPILDLLPINFDMTAENSTENMMIASIATGLPTSDFTPMITDIATEETASLSAILQPVYEGTDSKADDRKVVAFVWFRLKWVTYLQNILPKDCNGIIAVLHGSCPIVSVFGDQLAKVAVLSYKINGPNVQFLGPIDAHDPRYDAMEVSGIFVDLNVETSAIPEGRCIPRMSLQLYPSDDFKKAYQTNNKYVFGGVVVLVFLFTTLVFLVYDHFVRKRQRKVMDRIMRQDKIVADVFPSAIRDRLYGNNTPLNQLDPMEYEGNPNSAGDAPLADLFPNTTVVFADIAGFTAWSSAREPHQVFILLETIYGAFDKIAYRHGVFKVETVGDCYVAVAGLPEPIKDHAVMACKFARDCLKKMKQVTAKLEVLLGPDTAELDLRTGIHSGQVIAGVLRGERSRFQLFGDTMNTAARMESSGERNRVQLSQVTANMLREAGLSKWIVARKGKILVKGKGEMQTYWMLAGVRVKPNVLASKIEQDKPEESHTTAETISSVSTAEFDEDFELESEGFEGMSKENRLVAWHVQVLSTLLQQIMASRGDNPCTTDSLALSERCTQSEPATSVLEEFIPIIPLKRINEHDLKQRRSVSAVAIPEDARSQLKKYLSGICGMYRNNAFHNFEHASHVAASVKKLLSRIVNTDNTNGLGRMNSKRGGLGIVDLAGHSYGITSDPMTQFAVVFSAIIHDVDHPGVPNTQLVKENTRNAQIYKKSIAEQNSILLAWEMLMQNEYAALRSCIYQTEEELKRFRQLVVNTVLATDIVDKELQALRKKRWETAFSDALSNDDSIINEDRKATTVIEHLIQASDVSHTMQHWHIYKRWNERFFVECYGAYKAGRADTDPSINWYEGEICFFDFYVIPLAKKLDSCGVFGVSSDEYLNYAQANRDEWVREGKKLVEEFMTKYETQRLSN